MNYKEVFKLWENSMLFYIAIRKAWQALENKADLCLYVKLFDIEEKTKIYYSFKGTNNQENVTRLKALCKVIKVCMGANL